MFRKVVFMSAILCCQSTYAGDMGSYIGNSYEFGGQALYLSPSLGAEGVHGLTNDTSGGSQITEFDYKYYWGFKLWAAYNFNTGNDVNLNWYRLSGYTSGYTGVNTSTEQTSLVDDFAILRPKWNAVNLELGQKVNAFNRSMLRFHGGISFANIITNWSASALVNNNVDRSGITKNRTFNGFGPRIGGDFGFKIVESLTAHANVAAAMLAGQQKISTYYTNFFPGRYGKHSTVVPEVDTKLAVKYQRDLLRGSLTADLGWLWTTYFDAVLSDLSTRTNNAVFNTSNFNLQGLFFGLSWKG
ncbi:MAG: Lpg1974 family pore-forming outer membrane protein [Legionellaceae bacterium]|nr:Lpg1974 family pore-forming outer membrane protein [Legionellaceae bacterium]